MKKILFLALLLSTLAYVSCSKSDDNDSGQGDGTTVYLPVKMTSQENVSTFVYDGQNRLVEVKNVDLDNFSSVTIFVYNNSQLTAAQEKTTEVETKQDGTKNERITTSNYTFVYQDNKVLVTKKYTYGDSGAINTTVYDYNIDGEGKLMNGNTVEVAYDAKGNMIKMVSEEFENTYQFDDKNGMFKNVKTPHWAFYVILEDFYFLRVNNATSIKTVYKGSSAFTETIDISYQYNVDNYPVNLHVVGSDDFSNKGTIEYIKK